MTSIREFEFDFSSFENNKVSFYQNWNLIDSNFFIDNLYMLDVNCSYNEIMQTNLRGTKRKLKENSVTL